jgi:hypothetical protein
VYGYHAGSRLGTQLIQLLGAHPVKEARHYPLGHLYGIYLAVQALAQGIYSVYDFIELYGFFLTPAVYYKHGYAGFIGGLV